MREMSFSIGLRFKLNSIKKQLMPSTSSAASNDQDNIEVEYIHVAENVSTKKPYPSVSIFSNMFQFFNLISIICHASTIQNVFD